MQIFRLKCVDSQSLALLNPWNPLLFSLILYESLEIERKRICRLELLLNTHTVVPSFPSRLCYPLRGHECL